jgi:hypothetical protein
LTAVNLCIFIINYNVLSDKFRMALRLLKQSVIAGSAGTGTDAVVFG